MQKIGRILEHIQPFRYKREPTAENMVPIYKNINFLITWLNSVRNVNDGIITMVFWSGSCFIYDDVGKKRFFTNDFFGEINSVCSLPCNRTIKMGC